MVSRPSFSNRLVLGQAPRPQPCLSDLHSRLGARGMSAWRCLVPNAAQCSRSPVLLGGFPGFDWPPGALPNLTFFQMLHVAS